MTKQTSNKFSPEVRERAMRMVFNHQTENGSQWATIMSIASKAVGDFALRVLWLIDPHEELMPAVVRAGLELSRGCVIQTRTWRVDFRYD
jgi:hypothetical protein